jgi:hypothetical protein
MAIQAKAHVVRIDTGSKMYFKPTRGANIAHRTAKYRRKDAVDLACALAAGSLELVFARNVIPFLVAATGICACATGDPAVAQRNRVFYAWDSVGSRSQNEHERRYPPLDHKAQGTAPEYIGVEVLDGAVRLSRPENWVIRAASHAPGGRYVQYVSTSGYVFSVYERNELPDALWPDVQARYEKDLEDSKAELVDKAVPIATWNTQARAYLVRRRVPAAKTPFVNLSREYLARARHRIVLVQVVHPNSGLGPVSHELSRVIETLQLL